MTEGEELKAAIQVEMESLNYWANKRADVLGADRFASLKSQLDTAKLNIDEAIKTQAVRVAEREADNKRLAAIVGRLRETGKVRMDKDGMCLCCNEPLATNFHKPDCVWATQEDLDYHAALAATDEQKGESDG